MKQILFLGLLALTIHHIEGGRSIYLVDKQPQVLCNGVAVEHQSDFKPNIVLVSKNKSRSCLDDLKIYDNGSITLLNSEEYVVSDFKNLKGDIILSGSGRPSYEPQESFFTKIIRFFFTESN